MTLEYSHGMKKKLALAAALLPNPDLLFLDEPFEGVDAVARGSFATPCRRFVNRGATVFLTSHVLEIVEKLCTDVGIIAQGRLVLQSPMADDPPGRHARRAVPRRRGRRTDRVAKTELAGGVKMEKGDRHHLCAAPGTDRGWSGRSGKWCLPPFRAGWLEDMR